MDNEKELTLKEEIENYKKELLGTPIHSYTTTLENGVEVLTTAPDTKITKEEFTKYMNDSLFLLNDCCGLPYKLEPIEPTSSKHEIICFFSDFFNMQSYLDFELDNKAIKYMLFASSYLIQEGIDYIDDYYLKMLDMVLKGTDIYEYYVINKAKSGKLEDLEFLLMTYEETLVHLTNEEFNKLYKRITTLKLQEKTKLFNFKNHVLLIDKKGKALHGPHIQNLVDDIAYRYDRYKNLLYRDKGLSPMPDKMSDEDYISLFTTIEKESRNLIYDNNDELRLITLETIYVMSYLMINNLDYQTFIDKVRNIYCNLIYYYDSNDKFEEMTEITKSWLRKGA